MSRRLRLLLLLAASLAVGGCAYKPLKAPCAPDEGGLTVAYSSLQAADPGFAASAPAPATSSAVRTRCGPLKTI